MQILKFPFEFMAHLEELRELLNSPNEISASRHRRFTAGLTGLPSIYGAIMKTANGLDKTGTSARRRRSLSDEELGIVQTLQNSSFRYNCPCLFTSMVKHFYITEDTRLSSGQFPSIHDSLRRYNSAARTQRALLPHIFKVIKEAINGLDETASEEPIRQRRSDDGLDVDNGEDSGLENPVIERPGSLGIIRENLESINSTLTRRRRALDENEQRILNVTLQSIENIDKLFTQLHEVGRPAKSKINLVLRETLRLWSQSRLNDLVIEALEEADGHNHMAEDNPGDDVTGRKDTVANNDGINATDDDDTWF